MLCSLPFRFLQELDDTASFRNIPSKWGEDPEFPLPFGRTLTAAEEYVHTLDEGTGTHVVCVGLRVRGCMSLVRYRTAHRHDGCSGGCMRGSCSVVPLPRLNTQLAAEEYIHSPDIGTGMLRGCNCICDGEGEGAPPCFLAVHLQQHGRITTHSVRRRRGPQVF